MVGMIPPSEYDREELRILQSRLVSLTDPSRQVPATPEGRDYRRDLENRMDELSERLAAREGRAV